MRRRVPQLQQLVLGGHALARARRLVASRPRPRGQPLYAARRHDLHLEGELGKGPHAPDGELEQVAFRKRVDDAPGKTAVPLPVIEQRVRRQCQRRQFVR